MSRHVGKWGANRQSAPTERCNNPNLALSLAQEGQCSVFAGQERRMPTPREIADRLAQADHFATTGKPYAPSVVARRLRT
jgi:hypothetical protein